MRKRLVKQARRVVIKVGSSVLVRGCGEGGFLLSPKVFTQLGEGVDVLRKAGKSVTLVSSGAIAMGIKKLGLKQRPVTIPQRQAVAAVGQVELMARYSAAFRHLGMEVAQVLLTHDDLADRRRFLNARNTLTTLLERGIVPVINENDTVSVEEIRFGDNDNLSALVTNLVEADLLVILSDMDGLYDKDPKRDPSARKIALVRDIDSLSIDWSATGGSFYGTGGIASKVSAAKKAAHYGCAVIVANGTEPDVVKRLFEGEEAGTLILPEEDRLTSKKHWIAYSTRPTGRVFVDEGAKAALLKKGKSLLPSGVVKVEGNFEAGDVVLCVDEKGAEFARGVSNYSSNEARKIRGLKSGQIEKTLGYRVYDEVIHRDNLVVL